MQGLDLIVEKLNANGKLGMFRGENINRVTTHPKTTANELHVVAAILHPHELSDDLAQRQLVARAQAQDHGVVVGGVSNAVDTRNRSHNNRVTTFEQRFGCREPHLLDMFIDGGVFLDKKITLRNIGLGLVIVVIRNKVLHRILGKEFAHFRVQLGC